MALPSWLKPRADGVLIAIKVQPRASSTEIVGALGDALKIKVTAPPVDAAANEALLRLLAETLGCPRGNVRITRGQTSRHKSVLIQGMTPESVWEKLAGRP